MTDVAQRPGGRSPLIFVFLTVFIDLLGFGIVLPLLPVYTAAYGADEMQLGLLFASFSAMQFVFAPFWGRLSDRIGRRPILIGGLIGTSASYLVFAYSESMPLLFASRLLAGFFGANVSTAQAYIADVTSEENRARGMGLVGAAFGLGFTFGPLFGGSLTTIDPSAPGFVAAGLSLTAAVFGYFMLPEPPRTARQASRWFGTKEIRHVLRDGRIGVLFLLSYLFIFSFACFESMFTRFGMALFPTVFDLPAAVAHATREDYLRAAPIAGYYLCGIGVVAAVIQGGLIRRLVPRFGETVLAAAGPALLGLSFAVVGLGGVMSSWGTVMLGCAIAPLGFGVNNPALNSLISRASPVAEQGAYLGMNQSVASLARMTGPLFASYFFVHHGAMSPFFAAAGVLVVSAMLALGYRAKYGPTFAKGARAEAAL